MYNILRTRPFRRMIQMLPADRKRALWFWMEDFFTAPEKLKTQINPSCRKALTAFFEPDVRRLEELLGRTTPWKDFAA